MGDFLDRVTKQHLTSTSPNDLPKPISNYISMPDLSAVVGQPSRYWKITGDTITLLPKPMRDAVDAAILQVIRDSTANELDQIENILRAFALTILDEFNVLRSIHSLPPREVGQLKTAIRNKLGT